MIWANAMGLRNKKLIGTEGMTEGNDLEKCGLLAVV